MQSSLQLSEAFLEFLLLFIVSTPKKVRRQRDIPLNKLACTLIKAYCKGVQP